MEQMWKKPKKNPRNAGFAIDKWFSKPHRKPLWADETRINKGFP
jgi:hypothetical protein